MLIWKLGPDRVKVFKQVSKVKRVLTISFANYTNRQTDNDVTKEASRLKSENIYFVKQKNRDRKKANLKTFIFSLAAIFNDAKEQRFFSWGYELTYANVCVKLYLFRKLSRDFLFIWEWLWALDARFDRFDDILFNIWISNRYIILYAEK